MACIGWLAVGGWAGARSLLALERTSAAQMHHDWSRKQFAYWRWGRPGEREEVPMPIVGGLDIHRKQLTFDYLDTVTGEVKRGQIAPADRAHLRAWLARFAGRDDVA